MDDDRGASTTLDDDGRSDSSTSTSGAEAGTESHRGLGARVSALSHRVATTTVERTAGVRARHPALDRLAAAVQRYSSRSIGRQATVVTYAAYFLAFPLLALFLIVLSALFSASPRANTVVVRLLELPPGTDLGEIVSATSDTSWDALVGLIGVVGVVLAAAATASNLRSGMEVVFDITTPKRSLLRAPALDFSAGLWLAIVVFATWLLALGSLARRSVVNDVVGTPVAWEVVIAVKLGSIAVGVLLVAWTFDASIRQLHSRVTRRNRIAGSLAAGAFVALCNYAFLFTSVSLLADPNGGGGFSLALVLLLWVSVVVRGIMLILCWIAVDLDDTPSPLAKED